MKILICFFVTLSCIFAFPGSDYKEPATVKKFFPSTPLVVSTPSIAPDRSTFTTQREMLDYLGAIHKNSSSSVVNLLGPTKNGNYLPIFVLSRNKSLTFEKPKNRKITIMLIGQQHGDEPKYIADVESYEGVLPEGAVPYFDIFTLYPTNPNYPKNLNDVAMKTTENLIRDLKKRGYTGDYYYNPFIKPKNNKPLTLYRETSDKGSARNT